MTRVISYRLRERLYLNLTSRCRLRCRFCPKFRRTWEVQGYPLRLSRAEEPTADELIAEIGDPTAYREVVFCGLGEPTLRLSVVVRVGRALRARGGRVRLNTDGLASLALNRDVLPDLRHSIDEISISLNADNPVTYARHCRPPDVRSHTALLAFAERARLIIPSVTLSAIDGLPGVDIGACQSIADRLEVNFRARRLDDVG